MSFSFALFLFFIFFGQIVCGSYGVDISKLVSVDSFKCLKKLNYSFVIVRCYRSVGDVDPSCPGSVKNALAAGFDNVGGYMFPCPKCEKLSAEQQVKDMLSYLDKSGTPLGLIWIDVEGGDTYWFDDYKKNQEFFKELVDTFKSEGQKIGIYLSHRSCGLIMGPDCWNGKWKGGAEASSLVWYAHYQNPPDITFKDWYDYGAYGGWTKPFMKQFTGTKDICEAGIDQNYTPNPF